jgi:hypothetical protein
VQVQGIARELKLSNEMQYWLARKEVKAISMSLTRFAKPKERDLVSTRS